MTRFPQQSNPFFVLVVADVDVVVADMEAAMVVRAMVEAVADMVASRADMVVAVMGNSKVIVIGFFALIVYYIQF